MFETAVTNFNGYNAAGPATVFTVSTEGLVTGSLAFANSKLPSQGTVSSTRCTHLRESDQIMMSGCTVVMAM